MPYLIIGLVVLLALAPLWHFRPSRTQRRQARLREAAALAGLFVEMRDLPVSEQRRARMPAAERQVLYYGCRLPPSRGEARRRVSWLRDAGAWPSLPPRLEAPEIALQMPEVVLALAVSESSCGLFWREEGDEETVRDLAAALLAWRDDLARS